MYKARELYKRQDVVAGYEDRRFHSWKGRWVDRLEKHGIMMALLRGGIRPPARILDLPSGTGRISILLGQYGYTVCGVDISGEMVRLAGEKGEQLPPGRVEFRQGDGEDLDFADKTFDIAVCLRLFGHLPTAVRHRFLMELKRVSRRFVLVAYYKRAALQGILRRRFRKNHGIFWNPVSNCIIKTELASAGLKESARFSLIPGISETLLVLAERQE